MWIVFFVSHLVELAVDRSWDLVPSFEVRFIFFILLESLLLQSQFGIFSALALDYSFHRWRLVGGGSSESRWGVIISVRFFAPHHPLRLVEFVHCFLMSFLLNGWATRPTHYNRLIQRGLRRELMSEGFVLLLSICRWFLRIFHHRRPWGHLF